jgi:hypothetical protein
MAPKPGNAFAQQKELLRQKDLEIQPREEDSPSTPMTTMSMFIGPDLPQVEHEEPAELKTPTNFDPLHKPITGRGILGKRSFTDPLGATTAAHSTGIEGPSSFGKQSSGLGYIKSRFTGKIKKSKIPEQPSQPFTTWAPSEYPSNSNSSAAMSYVRRAEAAPEAAHTMRESFPSQPRLSHFSTTTTQSIATRQSQYASGLKNDAMILGNMSMSPTRFGSYAVAGYPAVVGVSHPSIVSMVGSILEASPSNLGTTANPCNYLDSSTQPETYDTPYTAPLPPPPGDEFIEQSPFHQKLPFYLQLQPYEQINQTSFEPQPFSPCQGDIFNTRTWEQMHAQHPSTMPQFSPMNPRHLYQDDSNRQTTRARTSNDADKLNELQKASIETSLYNANASDTKSENGREAFGALEDVEHATPMTLRRSVSNQELRYASHRIESPDRTPVAEKESKSSAHSAKLSHAISPTASVFRPAVHETSTKMTPLILKPDRYDSERPKKSELAQDLSQDVSGNISRSQEVSAPCYNGESSQTSEAKANESSSAPCYNGESRQASEAKRKESSSAQSFGDFTTRGGYPPTPQHPNYQVRSNFEEQMTQQFNVVHHHMDADKHSLRRCIEDAKNYVADKSSSQVDEKFMNQFRQMCIQNNGFRQYLERIEQQTSNLRPGIATDVLPGVSVEMASRFAAHENRYREEFRRMNKNLLTLNENVYAIQRNVNDQMAQMNRKIDLLLEAQGIDISSGGQHARQDRGVMVQKLRKEAQRRQDDVMNPAAMAVEDEEISNATAAVVSGTSSPVNQTYASPTKNRTRPLPTKVPIMTAALTSTPPHVPQLPQSQFTSLATVTITDSSVPSPSAVSNARRIRKGHTGERGVVGKENRRAGIVAKGLANTTHIQGPESHVHPALRYQEGIEKLAGGKGKQQVAEKKTEEDRNEVLWRRPSDNGEIGGRWYKAAMQQ